MTRALLKLVTEKTFSKSDLGLFYPLLTYKVMGSTLNTWYKVEAICSGLALINQMFDYKRGLAELLTPTYINYKAVWVRCGKFYRSSAHLLFSFALGKHSPTPHRCRPRYRYLRMSLLACRYLRMRSSLSACSTGSTKGASISKFMKATYLLQGSWFVQEKIFDWISKNLV